MKKLFALALALTLALSLAACGGNDTPAPAESNDPATSLPAAPEQGGTEAAVENKVDLSLDAAHYEQNGTISVTLDFAKLNKENAVIVLVDSAIEHGTETSVHDAYEEYRYLSDFSELPFFMSTPLDKDGLFDVRVYASDDGGEELASITIALGNATLPVSGGQSNGGGNAGGSSLSWPSIAYIKDADRYAGDGKIVNVKEWDASGDNSMWTVYFEGATFESVESYVAALVEAGWTNHYADEDGNYMEKKTEKGTARAYYCTCDYAELEIQVADFSNSISFSDAAEFSFNLSIQFSKS